MGCFHEIRNFDQVWLKLFSKLFFYLYLKLCSLPSAPESLMESEIPQCGDLCELDFHASGLWYAWRVC